MADASEPSSRSPIAPAQPWSLAARRAVEHRQLTAGTGAALTAVRSTEALGLPEALAGAVPGGGLRRGWHVAVAAECRRAPTGAVSLALALLAAALADDGWGVVVGLPSLGVAAMAEAKVAMGRLLVLPRPGRSWAEATATALEGADVVLLGTPAVAGRAGALAGTLRRLRARARRAGSVLVTVQPWSAAGPARSCSPDLSEEAELELVVEESAWQWRPSLDAPAWRGEAGPSVHAPEEGERWPEAPCWGRRRVTVSVSGRRAGRPSRVALWLPEGRRSDTSQAGADQPAAG
jgi:hypothetical protein